MQNSKTQNPNNYADNTYVSLDSVFKRKMIQNKCWEGVDF